MLLGHSWHTAKQTCLHSLQYEKAGPELIKKKRIASTSREVGGRTSGWMDAEVGTCRQEAGRAKRRFIDVAKAVGEVGWCERTGCRVLEA